MSVNETLIVVTTINSISIAILAIVSILEGKTIQKIAKHLSADPGKPMKVVTGNLIIKHWAGFISHEHMFSAALEPDEIKELSKKSGSEHLQAWAMEWNKRAAKAEARNNTLLVFEVPKTASNAMVKAIERFLQQQPETQNMKGPAVEISEVVK